jgi:hypothetical protein
MYKYSGNYKVIKKCHNTREYKQSPRTFVEIFEKHTPKSINLLKLKQEYYKKLQFCIRVSNLEYFEELYKKRRRTLFDEIFSKEDLETIKKNRKKYKKDKYIDFTWEKFVKNNDKKIIKKLKVSDNIEDIIKKMEDCFTIYRDDSGNIIRKTEILTDDPYFRLYNNEYKYLFHIEKDNKIYKYFTKDNLKRGENIELKDPCFRNFVKDSKECEKFSGILF